MRVQSSRSDMYVLIFGTFGSKAVAGHVEEWGVAGKMKISPHKTSTCMRSLR